MNDGEKKRRSLSLFSFSGYHFIDDGFGDSIYLLLPLLATDLHLSFSEVGLLKGAFSGAMSLLQFPLSLLGERIGELNVVGIGIFGLAGGFLLLSTASTFLWVFVALILGKGTAAGQHSLSSSILSRVYEGPGRRAAMGTFNFAGDVGKVCWPFFLAVLINLMGWRQGVFVLGLAGIAAGIILWTMAKRSTTYIPLAKVVQKETHSQSRWGISNWRSFFALLTIGVIDNSTRAGLLTFLPFLLLQKGIAETQIGFALTLLFAGGAAGKFACGVLAESFGIIPMVVVTEALTTTGIFTMFWSSKSALWILLPFVGVVLNGTSSVLYATVAEIISPGGRSRGYGLYYAFSTGAGAVSPVIYGFVTDVISLRFTLTCIALMVLITIPLSRFLASRPNPSAPSST